jgi:hypothetical protein
MKTTSSSRPSIKSPIEAVRKKKGPVTATLGGARELLHTRSAPERVRLHQGQVRVRRGDAHDATGVLRGTLLGRSWSLPLLGQQLKRVPRIGFLGLGSPVSHAEFLEAFRRGLRDYGYIEPETILVEYRWAAGHYDRYLSLRWNSRAKTLI